MTPTENTLKFYVYSTANYNLVPFDCSQKTVSAANVILDSWWNTDGNAVVIGKKKFLCTLCVENGFTYVIMIKFIISISWIIYFITFQIRTNNPDNSQNSMAKVMFNSNWIGGILYWGFRPSTQSFQNTQGLIGFYDNIPGNDFNILTSATINGTTVTNRVEASVDQMSTFWR